MQRFDNRDVAFDVPDGWKDQSVVVFEGPKTHGALIGTNVTLARVPGPGAASSLAAYATQQIANLSRSLPNFELVAQRNVTFGGLPAIEVQFHWRADESAVTQRITVFERSGALWSFSATALRDAFEQSLPGFNRIASSLKFVNDTMPGSPSSGGLPPTSRGGGSGGTGGLDKPRGW